ncbi:MAG: PRC-barrel domain-containing protein [Candidatus Berkelbacteria bacterium]|nr:PRC-barrel domain-containing protein [Candidatus Berkelbacteria bacterium]MCR4308291.1 PRC-barrel domain-containing protein [Candidatus Berkelbacteria bacterium]
MVLEVSQLASASIRLTDGKKLATVDRIIFDGRDARIAGFQTSQRTVLTRFGRIDYVDTLEVERGEIVIDSEKNIQKDLKPFDQLRHQYGTVLGVVAKTESGRKIGKISDLVIDADTGLIIRFYLGQFLNERIIPRQFLVSITPKQIVFKDIVIAPTFDEIAVSQLVA